MVFTEGKRRDRWGKLDFLWGDSPKICIEKTLPRYAKFNRRYRSGVDTGGVWQKQNLIN